MSGENFNDFATAFLCVITLFMDSNPIQIWGNMCRFPVPQCYNNFGPVEAWTFGVTGSQKVVVPGGLLGYMNNNWEKEKLGCSQVGRLLA